MNQPIYVSKQGLERLKADRERAERDHLAACEESATACALSGDGWHDNPYFNQSQQLEAALSRKVMELRQLEARAVVVPERERTTRPSRVEIGVAVRILVVDKYTGREEEQLWEIVCFGDGDKAAGKVAYDAPIAASLLGRSVGEIVDVRLGGRELELELLEIALPA